MRMIALPLVLAAALALQACNEQTGNQEKATPGNKPASLDTTEQRLSYSIAYSLGQNMESDGVPVQIDAFAMGLGDALSRSEPRLSAEEMQQEITTFRDKRSAEVREKQAAEAKANAAEAETFLAENADREGVATTDSGLQYEVLEEGDGEKPTAEDTVKVHYRGTLADGTEFDSSYSRGQPATFGVGQVIPGWTEALQMMPVGSKWKLFIPPELGYGPRGAGQRIPPNAALVFEVELLDIVSEDAGEAQAADGEGDDSGA